MKNPLIYIIFIAVLFSCGDGVTMEFDVNKEGVSDSKGNAQNDIINGNLNDTVDFKCQEWYPGKKQVKIEGGLDRLKRRHGTWYYYNESGDEMSMTTYTNGRKQGFSIVKHSNGALYYTGEYNQDQKVGIWKFYNEKGQKVNEINYTNE
jgi:antitoxin component YwqK of YwqJK toxin-antitoxin module